MFPWPQAGQVFLLMVHVWKARCVMTGSSGSTISGASANSCIISARYKKHDAGGDGVGVDSEAFARVSPAPGDSPVVRPLCVDSAGVSRAPGDSPVVRPLCADSAARGGPFGVDRLGKSARATACESEGNLGLLQIIEPHSRHNSSWVLMWLHVHVTLLCLLPLLLLLHLPFLLRLLLHVFALVLHLLLCLLLLHMRMLRSSTVHTIRGRTRLGHRVPRAQGGSKVGFPVPPKICVLSQRWRQG